MNVKSHFGRRAPLETDAERMVGGVESDVGFFQKVMYSPSLKFTLKSQRLQVLLNVPVKYVAPLANTPSLSTNIISVPENPLGSAPLAYETVTVPISVLFSSNLHSRVIRTAPVAISVVTSDPVAHPLFHQ